MALNHFRSSLNWSTAPSAQYIGRWISTICHIISLKKKSCCFYVVCSWDWNSEKILNTQYMTNSTLVSPVKMEYGWNFSISSLKMMMKMNFDQKYKFSNKNDMVNAWRNFINIFSRPLFTVIFRPEMQKFHPYSILTGQTMVRFVMYCVLMPLKVR